MSLTSPACPAGPQIMGDAERTVRAMPGVESVAVNLVWSPMWTPDRNRAPRSSHLHGVVDRRLLGHRRCPVGIGRPRSPFRERRCLSRCRFRARGGEAPPRTPRRARRPAIGAIQESRCRASIVAELRRATASRRSRAQSTPGSRSRRIAIASRTVLSADTRGSKVGSRSHRGALGNRGSCASGTSILRRARQPATLEIPIRARHAAFPGWRSKLLRGSHRFAPGELEQRLVSDDAERRTIQLARDPFAATRRLAGGPPAARRVRSRAPLRRRKPSPVSSGHRVPSRRANSSCAHAQRPARSRSARRRSRSAGR